MRCKFPGRSWWVQGLLSTWDGVAAILDRIGTLDEPSSTVEFKSFYIEGRGVAISKPGTDGLAWVWVDEGWRFAPGLASKNGVRQSTAEFQAGYPDAPIGLLIRLASDWGL